MNSLICPECQHANEPERIYCHNCGARLDRSKLLIEKAAHAPTEVQERKHLQKLFSRKGDRMLRAGAKFLKTVLGAVVCATIIVALLPPDLPPEPKNYSFAPMINMDLSSAVSAHRTAALVYNEEQVNSFIALSLKRKDSPAKQGYFPLERVLVKFGEGTCLISTRRTLFGYSIYSGGSYRVSLENGKIAAASTGGFIGRLSIPAQLMKLASPLMEKTWATLARERNSVERLAAIEFHPQSVSLIAAR